MDDEELREAASGITCTEERFSPLGWGTLMGIE